MLMECLLTDRQIIKIKGKLKGLLMSKKEKRRLRALRKEQRKMERAGQTLTDKIREHNSYTSSGLPAKDKVQPSKPLNHYSTVHGSYFKSCSHQSCYLGTLGEIDLYAATRSEIEGEDLAYFDVVVNASQSSINSANDQIIKGSAVFAPLKQSIKASNELWLDWSDGGSWPGKLQFWQHLHAINLEHRFKTILFCCFGGHGRTGTALAAYVIANSQIDLIKADDLATSVVRKIRGIYCKEAVETQEQLNYLIRLARERLAEDKVKAERMLWTKEAVPTQVVDVKDESQSTAAAEVDLQLVDYGELYKDQGLEPIVGEDGVEHCPKCKDLFIDCSCDNPSKVNQVIVNDLTR